MLEIFINKFPINFGIQISSKKAILKQSLYTLEIRAHDRKLLPNSLNLDSTREKLLAQQLCTTQNTWSETHVTGRAQIVLEAFPYL